MTLTCWISKLLETTHLLKREFVQPTGLKNVWDVMHKRKLVTFNSLKKTVKVKVKDKIINLKE